jgi:hypothetical protein
MLIASLLTVLSPGRAVAAESIPELQWPAVVSNNSVLSVAPNGDATESCFVSNLKTYNVSGQLIRELDRNVLVDGAQNCSWIPVFGKNGDLYGQPPGSSSVLAYRANTLKWKYPRQCSYAQPNATVGADGNVYFIDANKRLIGVTPDIKPPSTQPAKVLDVLTEGLCTDSLQAFKDGIAIKRGEFAAYYTYSGRYLGKVALSGGDQINAVGRMFSPTFVTSGGLRSLSISAYDPMTKTWAWKRIASGDGAYVSATTLHPTPDGGVLALMYEKELVGGVQTSEYVRTVVKLNSMGAKVWSKTLPKQQGSFAANYARLRVDSNGNIAIVKDGLATIDGKTNRAILLEVLKPNGTVAYSKLMHNDLGDVASFVARDFVVGANTLYMKAALCAIRYCPGRPIVKLYSIKMPGLGLDYPLNAVVAGKAGVPYVAMGDSYSSGEGVEPFEASSNTSTNKCHRSGLAYSKLVSGNLSMTPSLGLGKFVACSGAETKHITGRWSPSDSDPDKNLNEAPQIDALNKSTKYVSLTIGGNDMGFVAFGKACVLSTCKKDSGAHKKALSKINALSNKLDVVYKAILSRAPNAKIYIMGYPQVAPIKSSSDGFDIRCGYLYNSDSQGSWGDARAARDVVSKLNAKVKARVDAVRAMNVGYAQRLKFIDINASGSPFIGHTTCSDPGESYFNNVDQWFHYDAYTLHPNSRGQLAYAKLLTREMSK